MKQNIKHKILGYKYKICLNLKRLRLYSGENGRVLKSFKDKYKGQRCFIIGNGPSLTIDDLNKLKHEKTFAFNRIYYLFDKTDWRPSFYFTEDLKIIENSLDKINKLTLPYIFSPDIVSFDYNMKINNATYFKQIMDKFDQGLPKFSENFSKASYWGGTVSYTAMQMAVYMGFKEIYLIGTDHNFSMYENKDGKIIIDDTVKDYFCDDYNQDKENLEIPNLDDSTKAYIAARKYCDTHGVKIYNATRGGKLEVFERKDFDSVI